MQAGLTNKQINKVFEKVKRERKIKRNGQLCMDEMH